jgi:hypothetical protein
MTPEARFEAIERTLQVVADSMVVTQGLLKTVAESQARTHETVTGMAESISHYVDAADARMKRIEENLDGLIRAITAEHTNGKSKN